MRTRAASNDLAVAREEATTLEAQLLRDAWHGERRGALPFAQAVRSYLAAKPRSAGDQRRIRRIEKMLGALPLRSVNQAELDKVRDRLHPKGAAPATIRRGIVAPVRAVLWHAQRRGWCEAPVFEVPKDGVGRTRYLLPAEAERLIEAAAPHLRPLLLFLIGTGARVAEALELTWREVDLAGCRATLWTKGNPRRRRVVDLPPRVVRALDTISELGGRVVVPSDGASGQVFLWDGKHPYTDRNREGGGQIKTGFGAAVRRSGLSPLTPHDLRHTWASWHYALHKDPLRLQEEGQWSSLELVRRYTHLMPEGQQRAIGEFFGIMYQPPPVALAT